MQYTLYNLVYVEEVHRMINQQQIELNKERYLSELSTITREGFDKEALVTYLDNSDFFTAPASTRFHASYAGGLCEHSLNVYDNMCTLVKALNIADISDDTILIVSLMHDYAKINYYVETPKNVKVYSPQGSKHDTCGNYDWQTITGYTVDDTKRLLYGNHEMTSEFIVRQFVPLFIDESVAILHHHAGMSKDCAQDNITEVFKQNTVALLLHMADMLSTYYTEGVSYE